MNWSGPAELKAQLSRLWERGELLRAALGSSSLFPLRLVLKSPSSGELSTRFEAVRQWAAELAAIPHIRIEWRSVRHRVQGLQRLPERVFVDCLDDALSLVSQRADAQRFLDLAALTRSALPVLESWLARRPLQALELARAWPKLIKVVEWMVLHPRPRIYLRQADIPGVHSKFIEAHRGVLAELLDLALPGEAIAADRAGLAKFTERYGFLGKPARIRLRVLDAAIALIPGATYPDLKIDALSFQNLKIDLKRVFITENEVNFLAFPPQPGAIVVFGAGYGWQALSQARWLRDLPIHYWGDIDTHGFAILDYLRGHFEHVESFLMDRKTLMAHAELWGEEPDQVLHDLALLTRDERELFDDLRDNRIARNLRLEQERIGYGWFTAALAKLS